MSSLVRLDFHRRRRAGYAPVFVLGCTLVGAASPATASELPATSASLAAPAAAAPGGVDYEVGIGDELRFRFFYTPELDTLATVRSDGRVTLPLVGELAAAGLTLRALTDAVESGLATRVRRPGVAINVQGAATSQRVYVGGEVGRPGVQPLIGPLTVAKAVMAAEGLKDSAQARDVTVLRSAQGSTVALRVDLAAVLDGQDGARDLALLPGDVIVVPRSGIANLGLWVDQYVRRVVPFGLGFNYTINRNGYAP